MLTNDHRCSLLFVRRSCARDTVLGTKYRASCLERPVRVFAFFFYGAIAGHVLMKSLQTTYQTKFTVGCKSLHCPQYIQHTHYTTHVMALKRNASVLAEGEGAGCPPQTKPRIATVAEQELGAEETKAPEPEEVWSPLSPGPVTSPESLPEYRDATRTRCCALGLSSFPANATRIKAKAFRDRIEEEVAAVSKACRGGSRFLELQLRQLLWASRSVEPSQALLPKVVKPPKVLKVPSNPPRKAPRKPKAPKVPVAAFPLKKAVTQAFAAMQKGARPQNVTPGYGDAAMEWEALYPRAEHGVRLQSYNSLTYESNAYFDTLLSNYTKIALPAHVFWTLRHLFPDRRKDLKAVLIGRHVKLADLASGLPAFAVGLICECHTIQDADFSEATASRAIELRWTCLGLMDKAGPQKVTLKNGEVKDFHPKRFSLVPQCRRAARFITLDRKWANKALGLQERSTAKADPLFECFSGNEAVQGWRASRFAEFPSTVKTDGVQLHVPFEERVLVEEHSDLQDVCRRDPAQLATQFESPHPHGLFHIEAAVGMTADHPSFDNCVSVDPGAKNLVCTDTGMKITRQQFYGKRRPAKRAPPAPSCEARAAMTAAMMATPKDEDKAIVHSRAVRQNRLPETIRGQQELLKSSGLASGGQDHGAFVRNLTAWLKCAEDLRTFYGSRSQRGVRLVQASRKRSNMSGVVNKIAPDPTTVVLFGANFFGRGCVKGDVAGPVVVKGIRRALAKQRIVITIDEYNTTKCHLVCGRDLECDPEDKHEKWCTYCTRKVDRDRNAAQNIRAVWRQHLVDGTRPAHLRRPVRTVQL